MESLAWEIEKKNRKCVGRSLVVVNIKALQHLQQSPEKILTKKNKLKVNNQHQMDIFL